MDESPTTCTLVRVRSLRDLDEHLPLISEIADRLGGPTAHLLGVWCCGGEPGLQAESLVMRCGENVEGARIQRSFELSGTWAVYCFTAPPSGSTCDAAASPHHGIASALLSSDDGRDARVYLPVFGPDWSSVDIASEMRRLSDAFPQRIAGPLYRDQGTGRLSWTPFDA